jgi:hypothetical protein
VQSCFTGRVCRGWDLLVREYIYTHWQDDGSVTLAELNKQEARDRAHMQSLGGIVRGGQLTEDTAANPEVPRTALCSTTPRLKYKETLYTEE